METVQKRVRLGFRGPASFLVSYAVHLSRGMLVLPSSRPVELGEQILVELEIPGQGKFSEKATVVSQQPDDRPLSFSVEIDQSPELLLQTDALVEKYAREARGMRVLVVARDKHTRQNLKRQVRSTVASAQVGFAKTPQSAAPLLGNVPELALIDLGDELEQVQSLWSLCQSASPPLPCLLIASDETMAEQLHSYGAWDVLVSPPSASDFRRAVLKTLARPLILEEVL